VLHHDGFQNRNLYGAILFPHALGVHTNLEDGPGAWIEAWINGPGLGRGAVIDVFVVVVLLGASGGERISPQRLVVNVGRQGVEPGVPAVVAALRVVDEFHIRQIQPSRLVFIVVGRRAGRPVGDLGGREDLVVVVHVH